jgi:hypothetical protein
MKETLWILNEIYYFISPVFGKINYFEKNVYKVWFELNIKNAWYWIDLFRSCNIEEFHTLQLHVNWQLDVSFTS